MTTHASELVFVLGGTADGQAAILGIELQTGRLAFETAMPGAENQPRKTMAVEEAGIAVVTGAGDLYFLDRDTGAARWRQTVETRERRNDKEPFVLVAGGCVIVGLQGVTTCFDLEGRQLWARPTGMAGIGVTGKVVEPR